MLIIMILFISLNSEAAIASSEENFEIHMNSWNQNIKLASQYLDEAEKELKNGDAVQGCIMQKKAASYGIEATESLIKAFKANGSKGDIENFETGLRKWRELEEFC